jgi:hypothetical protein
LCRSLTACDLDWFAQPYRRGGATLGPPVRAYLVSSAGHGWLQAILAP